jgi:tetratricopeptide (TPR) repeat protein
MNYYQRLLPLLPAEEQVDIMRKLGDVLQLVGKWSEARDLYQQALALAGQLGDRSAQAWCQAAIGYLLGYKQGQYAEGSAWLGRARAGFDELGDEAGVAEILKTSGTLAVVQGDHEGARSLWEESLEIRREMGDKPNIANLLNNLGIVARWQGDFGLARSVHEEALAMRRDLGDRRAIAVSLNNLGKVFQDQGGYTEARSRLEEAVTLQREIGDRWEIANALHSLGSVTRDQGDYAATRALYEESLTIFRELGDRRLIAYLLEDSGALAALEGQPERALRLSGAASTLRETIGAPLSSTEKDKLEQVLGPARQALGEEAAVSAEAEGGVMSLEQAIDYALQAN